MKPTIIKILADFFANQTIKDLNDQLIEKAKVCVLDAIASAYAGHQTESSDTINNITKRFVTNSDQAMVWVRGYKTNYLFAAVNNCMLVHNMIHDDINQSTRGHAGNLLVPTVLAAAEAWGRPCANIIPALVAGYEVMGRIAAPAVPYSIERGFRSTPNYGTFGIAAAAGKILGLNAEQLYNAILCAGSYSLGLLEPFNVGTMEWRFQNSVAIMGGVMAVLAAKEGLKSAPTILEGDSGFLSAFCDKKVKDQIIAAWLKDSETLGKEYDISKTLFKPYSTCGYNQVSANIALSIIRKNSITPESLKEIAVKVSPDNKAYPGVEYPGPFETIESALMSKAYAIGSAVVTRDLQVETYRDKLNDPEILRIAKMVRMEADDSMGSMDTDIQFITKDGKVHQGNIGVADFSEFALTRDAVIQKFHRLAGAYISGKKIDEIAGAVFDLEKLKDISELTSKLTLDK